MAIGPAGPDPEVLGARPKSERSIAALLSDLASEAILLIRQEVALFKAELSEKLSRLGRGATLIGVGAFLAFSGWLVLLACAVLALATRLPGWLAALIVAVVVLGLGVVLLLVGKGRLDGQGLVPERTLRTLREDEAWIRERLR